MSEKTKESARALADQLVASLGGEWRPRVWDSGTFTYCAVWQRPNGDIRVYPRSGGLYSAMLCPSGKAYQNPVWGETAGCKDPVRAVLSAVEQAERVLAQLFKQVADWRLAGEQLRAQEDAKHKNDYPLFIKDSVLRAVENAMDGQEARFTGPPVLAVRALEECEYRRGDIENN